MGKRKFLSIFLNVEMLEMLRNWGVSKLKNSVKLGMNEFCAL